MKTKYNISLWALFVVVFFSTCKKDCPCEDFKGSNANFKIYDMVTFGGEKFEENTVAGGDIIFEVEDQTVDKVYWKIGLDTNTYTGKKKLLFFENMGTRTIQVKCITYKKAPDECKGLKKEWDTITKPLHFIELPEDFKIFGRYKGSNTDGTGRDRIVTLTAYDSANSLAWGCTFYGISLAPSTIMGLHTEETCNNLTPFCKRPRIIVSNSNFKIAGSNGNDSEYNEYCLNTKGTGKLDQENLDKIIINFNFGKVERTYKTFVGYRIK
jgi:hypothetical protein